MASKKIETAKYGKEQILASKTFLDDRDFLKYNLPDGEHTIEEVKELVKQWKGEVIK